jgi:hypothetical protein
MNMETRKHIAAEKKRCNSHNCAQAVLHTYADMAGISEQEAMNIAGAFGGGMGNMEGTCGALVGAGLVLVNQSKNETRSYKCATGSFHVSHAAAKGTGDVYGFILADSRNICV